MSKTYKEKYLNIKREYIRQKNAKGGALNLLNNLTYIDTLKLNDAILYKDKHGLYVMDLSPNNILWRAYNNNTCNNLSKPPGSSIDKYRFEPVWYGSPEAIIVYCAMNINDEIMRRSYNNYNKHSIDIDYNVDEYVRRNYFLLRYNLSSIIAYSPINPYKLIDINNIENIKKLLKMYEDNYTESNFKKLYSLNRVTGRQTRLLSEWQNAFVKVYKNKKRENPEIVKFL